MKSFEVKALGLEELSVKDKDLISGGSVTLAVIAISMLTTLATGLAYDIISNPHESASAFRRGASYNPYK